MGHVRASPAAELSGHKSKAPHTASVRDAVGLGLECHFSQCSTPAQGRLLGLVGQTRGSNVPTPTRPKMQVYTVKNEVLIQHPTV